jgi:hypothetical protein
MSSSPAGGSLRQAQDRLRLPADKHRGILTEFQTKVNKKIKNIHCRFLTTDYMFFGVLADWVRLKMQYLRKN